MMIFRLRRNACIEERCQKGKKDLSQASFKYTHFAVAGKSSYEDERRSLRHHHMMISDAEGLIEIMTSQFTFSVENAIYVGNGHGAWSAKFDDPDKWIQVDFAYRSEVKGIITQVNFGHILKIQSHLMA